MNPSTTQNSETLAGSDDTSLTESPSADPSISPIAPPMIVSVTAKNTMPGHQPGDKGTVLAGPILRGGQEACYIVAMDKGGGTTTSSIFGAEEIEPDV